MQENRETAAVCRDLLFRYDGRVRAVKAQDVGLHHLVPVGFPPACHLAQCFCLGIGEFTRIHLEAHVPLGGRPGAHPDIDHPAGGVAMARADVGTRDRRRQEQGHVVLDALALQGVSMMMRAIATLRAE